MAKRMTLMLIAVAVVFGGIFGFKAFMNAQMQKYFASAPMPPSTVSTAKAESMRWAAERKGVGTVVADQSVALSAEVSGRVTRIGFRSGDVVEAGTVLLELDPALDQAELRSLQTQLRLASEDYERIAALYKQQRVSKAERDAALSQRDALSAQAAAREAALAKKTILAPFAGRLGIRQVSLGQVVQPGDAIVHLASLEPLHVDFTLPAQDLAGLSLEMPAQMRTDTLEAPLQGRLTAMESVIDETTRNIRLRATLDEAPAALRAGSFAEVRLTLPGEAEYIVVPRTAVSYQPYGNTVFVVEPPAEEGGMPTAQQRFIKTGSARGDFVAVLEGLSLGEEVITSGQLKVRNGSTLSIDNSNAPAASLNPTPANS